MAGGYIASDATRQRRQLLSGAMRLKSEGFNAAAGQLAGQAELVPNAHGIMKQGELESYRATQKAAADTLREQQQQALTGVTPFGIDTTTGLAKLTAESGSPLAARQQFFNDQVAAIRSGAFKPEEAKQKALGMGISEAGWAAGLTRMPAITNTAAADKAAAEKAAAEKKDKEKNAAATTNSAAIAPVSIIS